MSSIYLLLALAATFAAVGIASLRIGLTMAERRRSLRLLESQVGQVASANLREQELSRSVVDRVLVPVGSTFGKALQSVTPSDMRERLAARLLYAGSPAGWDAEKVAAMKMIGLLVGAALGILSARGMATSGGVTIVMFMFMSLIGFFAPNAILSGMADRRQDIIRKALPDTMDLLTISVEAGLGLDAAMSQVLQNVPGPLSQEISRLLQEMRLGVPRIDAFRHLAARTNVEELNSFILAMVQAEQFGVSISSVLRAQANELRTKRRQRAEEQAMKIPIKILFPLIFCILPCLLIVILGPGAIRIAENLFGASL